MLELSDTAFVDVEIRPMTEDDLDRVCDIEGRTFPSPWRRSFFVADMERPGSLCIVADAGESGVLGYLVAWHWDEVHVANVAVDSPWRRRGIGKRLMSTVIRWAAERGASSIYLEVRASNEAAQRFYAGLGFVQTYRRKGYYENAEDAIVMEREVVRTDLQR